MKIPAAKGVIIVYGDQQTARNIEKGVTLGQKNGHHLANQAEADQEKKGLMLNQRGTRRRSKSAPMAKPKGYCWTDTSPTDMSPSGLTSSQKRSTS